MTKPFVYIAGDIMSTGSQYELERIEEVVKKLGFDYYSPIKNKDINDKSNVTEEENNILAERIVKEDTERLMKADIVIFNYKNYAEGTKIEIGQCLGWKQEGIDLADYYWQDEDTREVEEGHKKYICLFDDIRNTNLNEKGFRRSHSINQYIYGAILELTDGKGFIPFEDLEKELKACL